MFEELRNLISDLKFFQRFWSYEALVRQDEIGRKYAEGVSYGFELAAAILETRKPK